MGEKAELTSWWAWGLGLLLLTAIAFGVLNALGLVGGTYVERKVFEQSYQRSEAKAAQATTYRAQLAEIEAQLARTDITSNTRRLLEAQAASIRVQLAGAK